MSTHVRARRRRWVPAAVVALVLSGGGLAAVELRASAVAGDHARVVEQQAAEAARVALARVAADREARASARVVLAHDVARRRTLAVAWTAATGISGEALARARNVLAESDGQVSDDAVRADLAAAIGATEQALTGIDAPDLARVGDLARSAVTLSAATVATRDAHEAWQAARRAAARAAPAPPASSWTLGAGADCGGSGSYQPATGDASAALFSSVPSVDGDGSNGHMPRSAMTPLGWCVNSRGDAQWLRSDAAAALVRLNDAFRTQFGENIAIDLSYRSYADQVRAKQLFGNLAATPGTSNHGLGLAIDVYEWKAYAFGSARYEWLVAHGPDYGWVCPAATRSGDPEYWHYEYVG
ncbi:M15 family metallopeptidase [Isoptericola sp. b490]|uniref:M15 family metallopeptidase n=1 Tax=Actinotalea lenta TaxID=3064654 RepID=UPI0027139B83|nr:M15 family metallopeptidase [Isoptericola sp. b490]MDO8119940.1 M15 family metallopeptidase [Isoptericola sp. b490]